MTASYGKVRGLWPFLLLVSVAVVARLYMVLFLPPLLDVYYYDSQAAKALLSGIDPYGFSYFAVPAWLATPGASTVFVYLPGVVLFLAPFGAAWDVRLGLIAADLLIAWGIHSIGGRWARTATLVFLLLPSTVLFSTSYPNNTLVSMAFLGAAVALWFRGRGLPASILLGVSFASSQFVWLLFPFFLVWSLRSDRRRQLALSAIVAFSLTLPFLLWNWNSFIYDTLFFEFTRAPRTIVSAAAFGLNVNPTLDGIMVTLLGVSVPLLARALATLALLAYAIWRSKDFGGILFNGSWFVFAAVFVLPNVFSWWYLELPFQTFLMWFVASRGRGSFTLPANP